MEEERTFANMNELLDDYQAVLLSVWDKDPIGRLLHKKFDEDYPISFDEVNAVPFLLRGGQATFMIAHFNYLGQIINDQYVRIEDFYFGGQDNPTEMEDIIFNHYLLTRSWMDPALVPRWKSEEITIFTQIMPGVTEQQLEHWFLMMQKLHWEQYLEGKTIVVPTEDPLFLRSNARLVANTSIPPITTLRREGSQMGVVGEIVERPAQYDTYVSFLPEPYLNHPVPLMLNPPGRSLALEPIRVQTAIDNHEYYLEPTPYLDLHHPEQAKQRAKIRKRMVKHAKQRATKRRSYIIERGPKSKTRHSI